jgi:hypothetical protein
MAFDDDHPSAVRLQSYRQFKQNYFDALRAIDTPGEAKLPLLPQPAQRPN